MLEEYQLVAIRPCKKAESQRTVLCWSFVGEMEKMIFVWETGRRITRVHAVSVFVSNCQYFWVQCQSKILSLKMSVPICQYFEWKVGVCQYFYLKAGNKG